MMKKWTNENRIYIAAFFMPFIALLAVFIGAKVYPFGDRSFLHIDMYHQYYPMLVDMYRAIKGGGVGSGLLYSWNAGLGSNFVAEYAYYLASPFNLLCLLFKEDYLIEFMSYMVVVKSGFMGVTFAYYLVKHFNRKKISVTYFSTFYALSGFMAAYNWDVMWIDVLVLTPLIILGLEWLVEKGDYRLYTITLGLAILSNYYISIMLCIYLVLYFAVVLFPGVRQKVKSIINFGVYSILSGAMGAVLLLPTFYALQLSKFSSTSFPEKAKVYFSIFDILGRHMMDVAVETGLDHWPNIYCSVAMLVFVPLYVCGRHINIREKIGKLILLAFMLISFSSNIMTFMWHGFNYPDSLPCRQSFLYIILILTIGYEAFINIREYDKSELGGVFLGVSIFIVLAQKLITDDAFTGRTYLLTGLFLIAYAILLYLHVHREAWRVYIVSATILVVVLEAFCNTLLTSVPTVSRPAYLKNYNTYNELYDRYNELADGKLYRFENVDGRVRSDDSMLHNYMSTSLFSSTSNGLVGAFYKNYGMRTSKVFYCHDGMTPLISALLSNKYVFYKEGVDRDTILDYVDTCDDIMLYSYKDSLPLGYMLYKEQSDTSSLVKDKDTAFSLIDGDMEDTDSTLNPVERQNALVEKLGINEQLYSLVDEQYTGDALNFVPTEDAYYIAYCDTKKIGTILAKTPEGDKKFDKTKNPYILDLGYIEFGESAYIYDSDNANDLHISVYSFNEDVYKKAVQSLSGKTLDVTEFKSDSLKGSFKADKDGYLILSIPYDPGFRVYLDGEKVESYLFLEMMFAIPAGAGEHTIQIDYFPQGLVVGGIISLVAILTVVISVINYSKRGRISENE